MTELFLNVLGMSISALWLIGAVLLLRLVLKKAPKGLHVLLWALVAVRLVCPFSSESKLSLIPEPIGSGAALEEWSDDYVSNTEVIFDTNPKYEAAVEAGRTPIPSGDDSFYVVTGPDQISEPETVENTVLPGLAFVWTAGMAVLLVYAVCSYLALCRKMATAVLLKRNIYQSEAVDSPFVLGLIRPKIYLPFSMEKAAIPHVLAHERAHIRRKDHWWKPLGFLVLTVHWFNPAVWLSFVLLCRDIELACDERVIREMDGAQQADYSQALLSCSIHRRSIAACPLAFGEVGVKRRVRNILHYKKPAFWVILIAIALSILAGVCFLTNPVMEEPAQEFQPTIQWFDYLENGSYPLESDDNQAKVPHFPDVTFRADPGAVYAETEDGSVEIISGIPVWNVYFSDLTGDGIYELCATVSEGSGIIDEHVVIFDYAAGKEYTLHDRGSYDYILRLKDGVLICDKHFYPHADIAESGELKLVKNPDGEGMVLTIVPFDPGESSSVEFSGTDFSGVTAIKLSNAHNGKSTAISDPEAIEAICAWLSDISGSNGRNSKGRHYQGTFALTMLSGDEQVFQITFGDEDVFFYGMYDKNYAMMYDLDRDIDDVIHFLCRYDESGFDWGFEETVAVEETTPYAITSTIPTDSLKADIEYLQPGDIIAYGMLKEEWFELAVLLNNLMPEAFEASLPYTPTMKINVRWDGGRMTLYSDGRQTVFGEDGQWAVRTQDLNKFLDRFSLGQMAGGEQLPLDELNPYYNFEQAMIDGCVVLHDHDIRENADVFTAFADAVYAGSPATVRIAEFSSEERFAVQVSDIIFDGEGFTWRAIADGQLYERHYSYLCHFSGEPKTGNPSYDAYDAYVLTNERNATWQQLWDSLTSSQAGVAIDFTLVYMDYIYYPNHPVIPDCKEITLEFEGKILKTDINLDAIETLFAQAEETYEPKTWNPGPILRFTGKDGTEVIATLDLDSDWFRIDGIFYDFGPGYDENGSYDARAELYALMGIERLGLRTGQENQQPANQSPAATRLEDYINLMEEDFTAIYILYSDGTVEQLRTEDIPAIQAALRGAEVSDGSTLQAGDGDALYHLAITRADGVTMGLSCWEDNFQSVLDTGRNLFLVMNPSLLDAISTALEHIG